MATNKVKKPTKPSSEPKIAYTIKDENFPNFQVLKSANAWWMDRLKVERLIAAYKFDAIDTEARAYAGISEEQLRYFKEKHPEFYQVKEACKELVFLKARQTVVKALDEPDNAKWFLERKRKKEFSARTEVTGADGGSILTESYEQRLKRMREEDAKQKSKKN